MLRLSRRRADKRRGTAVIETAVALPAIALLVFGSIEAANSIFVKQALTSAAFEAAAAASKSGATDAAVRAHCEQVLDARGITERTIAITPIVEPNMDGGTVFTVTVTAPASSLSIGTSWMFRGQWLEVKSYSVRIN
ncbi:MAG: TadE/TadG family type IV pilus assembly protein [Pirellulaceae bacterium]